MDDAWSGVTISGSRSALRFARIDGRFLRATMAIVTLGCLALSFFVTRGNLARQDQQLALNMSELSWKVSETLLEARALHDALSLHSHGALTLEALTEEFEVFWTSLEVLRFTKIRSYASVGNEIERMRGELSVFEPNLYRKGPLPHAESVQLAVRLSGFSATLRELWTEDFLQDEAALIAAVTGNGPRSRAFYDLLIIGCMALLGFYAIAELWLANRAQARERALREAAISASEAKSVFLANVSHELRTPLNGVLGMAQELRESALNADQRELVEVICTSGTLLLSTINDVLDLSKIEAGHLQLEVAPFDLAGRIQQCLDLYAAPMRDKALVLRAEIARDVPTEVLGDALRVSQVLNNLLSNAVKFTATGGIDVRVACVRDGPDAEVSISVCDTGIGISPEAQERIFLPFTQADTATTRLYGGTGLGLPISREICRKMGGELGVDSRPGEGSTFTARLRLGIAQAPESAVARDEEAPAFASGSATGARSRAKDLSVLVVDDSLTNRQVLRRFLRDAAARIDEAGDGEEAIAAVIGGDYDVVLMDVQMPGLDGLEATRRIRLAERRSSVRNVPIIAVTANVMKHQVASYLECGMDYVVAKPVRKAEILDLLGEIAENSLHPPPRA